MATPSKRAKQKKQQQDPAANSYVPAKPRPANRPLIGLAIAIFAGWLVFLLYTAIQTS